MVLYLSEKLESCWWRHQAHFNERVRKNVFSCIWSMFSFTFRHSITKSGEHVKELSLSSRWFVLPYFAAFRYNIGNNSTTWSGRKLRFGMLVESLLCFFHKTKRMKSRFRFSSNCHLKKCNFLCCHILSIECQFHNLLFLAKRMIPRSSKSDNQKQSYANFKSSAFANEANP